MICIISNSPLLNKYLLIRRAITKINKRKFKGTEDLIELPEHVFVFRWLIQLLNS